MTHTLLVQLLCSVQLLLLISFRLQVAVYLLRWAAALGMLELMTRTLYFNAIARFKLFSKGSLQHLISDVSGGTQQVGGSHAHHHAHPHSI